MAADKFIEYITYEKRFSKHTVEAYKNDIDQFSEYCQSCYNINSLTEINHMIIRSWIVSLIEKELSNKSINRKLSSLKSYFRFLLKEGLIKETPFNKVITPKSSSRLPQFIESRQINHLLDETEFENNHAGIRAKTIIELFYATGMRLSELISINEIDIDFNNGVIKVLGKRNKERLIPFGYKVQESIKEYQKIKREEIQGPEVNNSLFVTEKGKKMYPRLVYRIVNNYLNKVTTQKKKSPHILRHTFATHMLNQGADLNAIKDILGHANLNATQIYTHNTIEQLKSIHQKSHPREKIRR